MRVDAATEVDLNWMLEVDFAAGAARAGISITGAAKTASERAPASAAITLEIMIFTWIFKRLCYHDDTRFLVRAYFD